MKVLITGGHLTPALAVIDKIIESYANEGIQIVFVGRKYALDSEQTYSLEYKEICKRNIPFISLHAGKVSRMISLKQLKGLLKVPLGFIHALFILRRERPDVIMSFGGYLAIPIAVVGHFLRIKVYTHEQTICPGFANRIISFYSTRIFYSFPETKKYFPTNRSVLSGNPVRSTVFKIIKKPFEIKKTKPVIYVTGGSLGSHSINQHIRELLPELLKDYIVIHQIGDVKEYNDYEKLKRYRRSLDEVLKERYFPVEHFFDDEVGYVYSVCDVVLGRSGANTFFELIHLKKPAILIPLPWSANKEQQKQADFFVKHDLGAVFEQRGTSRELLKLINDVVTHKAKYQNNFKILPFTVKRDATNILIQEILKT